MKNYILLFLIPFVLISCSSVTDNWKELNLGEFKISVPQNWRFPKPGPQEDSFVGEIIGPKVELFFDCSDHGYANHLLQTEQEYLNGGEWKQGGYFYKTGTTYTANFNVKNTKLEQMKKLGTTDSSLVHVEADPSYETKIYTHLPTSQQKIKYPQADYIADMIYRDSTISVPVKIPLRIKSHNILIDSNSKYVFKTIWPKIAGKGMTGIYIHSRSSSFNFNMSATNLSPENQELALKVFKTIIFKQ